MAQHNGVRRRGADSKGLAPRGPASSDGGFDARSREDDVLDSFFEVPAAVLCAVCGEADCPGCSPGSELESGVVAIVPWERRGAVWTRLWATATATTQGAEAFFAVMPDGELPPAMRFALLAELLAVASMATVLLALVALVLPGVALQIVQSPASRSVALRWLALGVPLLALWMVLAHVTHGAALDAGARREGARPQRRRAVRFGLYACGWDLMAGPLGAAVMLVTRGLRDALDVVSLAVRVRARATTAFLDGIYELSPERGARAQRFGSAGGLVVGVVTAMAVIALALGR